MVALLVPRAVTARGFSAGYLQLAWS